MTRKTSTLAFGVVAAAIVSGAANAEIVTSRQDVTRFFSLDTSGLGFDFHFNSVNTGGGETVFFMTFQDTDDLSGRFLINENHTARDGINVYAEGFGLAGSELGSDNLDYLFVDNMFDTVGDRIGALNELQFIGFALLTEGAINYGFIQFIRTGPTEMYAPATWEIAGWAYETESGRDLVTFDITVPAPSSLALLGLGGLGVARRRR